MFPSGVVRVEESQATSPIDRDLIGLLVKWSGVARGGPRLQHTHPSVFEEGAPRADLPLGWEQRADRKSGRIFFVNHNLRTTCWSDPRVGTHEPPRGREGEESEEEYLEGSESEDERTPPVAEGERGEEEGGRCIEAENPSTSAEGGAYSSSPSPLPLSLAPLSRSDSCARRPPGGASTLHSLLHSELRLLAMGVLPPTSSRLSRRSLLQLQRAQAIVDALLPGAADPQSGVRPRGFALLRQRRFRLLQQLHVALLREEKRSALGRRAWKPLYEKQREEQQSSHKSKGVQKALESLSRHCEPSLTTSYSTWFKTRSHLARCTSVLHQLAPLQLHGHVLAEIFQDVIGVLQHKLLALASEQRTYPLATPRGLALIPAESDGATSTDTLRAMLRLALVRGELDDHLIALGSLMAASGWTTPLKAVDPYQREGAAAFPLVGSLLELERTCAKVVSQRGLSLSESASLGVMIRHPTLGIKPSPEFPSRASLLSNGQIEAGSAAAVLSALLAQAAVGTVWGVGPWEHDFNSLLSDPSPDEIAVSVVLAAAGGADDNPSAPPTLPLNVPICIDVSPHSLHRLFSLCSDALTRALALTSLESAVDCALLYTCLSLLRLLKVHLHYISVCRIDLGELGLDIQAVGGADHDTCPKIYAEESFAEQAVTMGSEGELQTAESSAAGALASATDDMDDGVEPPGACSTAPASASGDAASGRSDSARAAECSAENHRKIRKGDTLIGPGAALVRHLRLLLLRLATEGKLWIDPAIGNPVGEHSAAEAIAVLQVGRDVFFPSAEERRQLLLRLLSRHVGEEEEVTIEGEEISSHLRVVSSGSIRSGLVESAGAPSTADHGAACGDDDPSKATSEADGEACPDGGRWVEPQQPTMVLAEVLMASFAQQAGASHLVINTSEDDESSEGGRLLRLLVELIVQQPERDEHGKRCNSSAALALYSAILWGLLSRAALCANQAEPAVGGLVVAISLLLERVADQVGRKMAGGGVAGPLVAMVPLVCSGLALQASFVSFFAHGLLPVLISLSQKLSELQTEGSDAEAEAARIDRAADFELGQPLELIESSHPYDGGSEVECAVCVPAVFSCIWLDFDKRCCTMEGDAALEVLVDGALLHSFSGPATQWPTHPIVLPSTSATLKLTVQGGARQRDVESCWGFACHVRGFEPTLAPKLPPLVDCQEAVVDLGAKYAAALIVGEPLSPEEHVHFDTLESMVPDLDASGHEAWRVPGLAHSLLSGLLEKRQRRALSRLAGLDAMLAFLRTTRLPTLRKHVLLHLAAAFKALQGAATFNSSKQKQLRHGSVFLAGCRGCETALEGRVRTSLVQLFELLSSTLRAQLRLSLQGREECGGLVAVVHVFLLRFQPGDLEILSAAGLMPMIRALPSAHGEARRLSHHLLRHLILCTFVERSCVAELTTCQADVLSMLKEQLAGRVRSLAEARRCAARLESDNWRLLSLLFSLCARHAVRAHLCASWLPLLMQLLKIGSERLAALSLRLLRFMLSSLPPDCPSLTEAVLLHFDSPASKESAACPVSKRAPLVALLLEAIGREACADAPLLALCCGHRGDHTAAPISLRCHGSPGGVVINGLVSLVRGLQHDGGEAWAFAVGRVLSTCLDYARHIPPSESQRGQCQSLEIWLLVGSLSVAGGHVEALHEGGRAVHLADSHQSTALIVGVDETSVLLYTDAGEQAAAAVQLVEAECTTAIAEVEPAAVGMDPHALALALTSLISAASVDGTVVCPLLELVRAQAIRAMHALLTGEGGPAVARALLGSDALPLLLQTAVRPVARFDAPAKVSIRSEAQASDELALMADVVLADAAPAVGDVDGCLDGSASSGIHGTASPCTDAGPADKAALGLNGSEDNRDPSSKGSALEKRDNCVLDASADAGSMDKTDSSLNDTPDPASNDRGSPGSSGKGGDTGLIDNPQADAGTSGSHRWHGDVRLAIMLSSHLDPEEHLLELASLGYSTHKCEAALRECAGEKSAALAMLSQSEEEADADEPENSEKRENAMVEKLVGMGFSAEQAECALKRTCGDLHRAADWLLEGGVDNASRRNSSGRSGSTRGSGASSNGHGASSHAACSNGENVGVSGGSANGSASSASAASGEVSFSEGEIVEARDSCGLWHTAEIVAIQGRSVRLHYNGWCTEWDEWLSASSPRLRRKTGRAATGPTSLRCSHGEAQSKLVRASRPGAEAAGDSPTAGARPRWFWRQGQGSSTKRRAAAASGKGASDLIWPSAADDFFASDVGLSSILLRGVDEPQPAGASCAPLRVGQRCRIARGEHAGAIAAVVSDGVIEKDAVVLRLLDGHALHEIECAPTDVERVESRFGAAVPALAGRSLRALFRAQCMLHRSSAVIHSRLVFVLLLCEMGWLHAAHDTPTSSFQLSDLEGLLPDVLHVLKLTLASHHLDGHPEGFSMAYAATRNLLTDSRLHRHASSFSSLPSLLAAECVRFLAHTATSTRQVESAHPCEPTESLQMLCCPGAGVVQLQFDARSALSKSGRLALYLDAACMQEVASFDSDDYLPGEVVVVRSGAVWVHHRCDHNREHAWGFKLRATPMQWRERGGGVAGRLSRPFDHGWELLQLLVEEVPADLARPDLLANLLRYLQHGRAPHKEKVVALLLRALPCFQMNRIPFDWALFGTLEQQVAWHDHLLRGSHQVDCALLPKNSQAILSLLLELRNVMQGCGLHVWHSSLGWMGEIEELNHLSKWLLHPDETQLPAIWTRLAATRQLQDVTPAAFDEWPLVRDLQIVQYLEAAYAPSGSLLNARPSILASLSEEHTQPYPQLECIPPATRCFRFALLQRFNQLVHKHLPLVHTGTPHAAGSIGGRICQLRGVVFMEVKQAMLEQVFAALSTEADAICVSLNRFRAARGGVAAGETHSLFVQLHDQLRHVKPKTLCRHDKAFKANFVGESADDHGGPYREAIAHICGELQSDALPLLIRCPNGSQGGGSNRDAFLPNPSACSGRQTEWFSFLGLLLGLALRQRETQLCLTLPSVVWKQLTGEALDADDLSGFDAMCRQSLDKIRCIDREGVDAELFSEMIFETFTTQLSDGSEVELRPAGGEAAVTFENRLEFCQEVLNTRLHESQRQCEAIMAGLASVVPQRALSLLSWQQLELLSCGRTEIDIEVLRSRAKYGIGVSPGHRHIRHFWNTLRRFTPDQRALFLRFVWGRTRLPATTAEWGDVRFTLHTRHASSPDSTFPVAHTCFFSLELPAYSSAAICYEKLLYAITNCQAIDIDTTQSARDNRDAVLDEGDS